MIAAVEHGDFDVDHRVTGEHAFLHGLLHALVDRGNEATGDSAALDLVDELVARPWVRGDAQPTVAELPGATRLLLVTALRLGGLADGLAIRDAHRHEANIDARLLLAAGNEHVDLRVAHRGEHGLVRFLVALDVDRRVVFRRAGKKRPELVLFLLVDGLDRDRVLRHRQRQGVDGDLAGKGNRVARASLGELRHDDDVARLRALHVGGFLAHHDVEMAQTLLLARARVDELHAGLEHAREHFKEAQAAHERVGERLEGEGRGAVRLVDGDGGAVGHLEATVAPRVREVGADVFHKPLNTLLDDGGAHEHGDEQLLRDGLVEQRLELVLRELLLAFEIFHHELVVGLGHKIAQLVAGRLRGVGELGGNGLDALGVVTLAEVAGFHADDVNDALEVSVLPDGDGDRAQTRAEARVERGHGHVEVGVLAVDMIDEHGS